MKTARIFVALLLCWILVTTCQSPRAELVLRNGTVYTVDSTNSVAEALAVSAGRIAAVGSNQHIERWIGSETRVIDLQGKPVIPGLIESHAHFLSLGRSMMRLQLSRARSFDEIVQMVAQKAAVLKPGQWILGRGWHQEKWDKRPAVLVEGNPVHTALSAVSPHNPVMLTHASGHAILVNAKAMELAAVTAATPDPAGGRILRFRDGQPSGVFLEEAGDLIAAAWQKERDKRSQQAKEEEWLQAIELAQQACLQNGITTFHDAGAGFREIDYFKKLAGQELLDMRLWVMIAESNDSLSNRLEDYRLIGYGNNFLTVRAIKKYMDGALGAHGAWLLQPYTDLPTSSGLNTTPLDELRRTARLAADHGFQLCTHAIGDRANRETLDLYEAVIRAKENRQMRWRIEHAQHLDPADIGRFAQLGVIAAMQGIHCTSDGPWVEKRLGRQRSAEGAYVWRKLIDSGAVICNGTDAPVEEINPMANFYASITRRTADGWQFYPEHAMTRVEALRSYTINGAYAGFEEHIKGSIEKGKLADLTVLSRDIMTIPEAEILNTKVLYTIVGGQIKYSSE